MPLISELTSTQTLALGLYGTGTLITLVCLGAVMSQENALRRKVLLIFAFLATLASLTGLLAGLVGIFLPSLAA